MRLHIENTGIARIENTLRIHIHSATLKFSNTSMPNSLVAIYPGSFDPPTNGHLDLIARGASLVNHLIVAVLQNTQKKALFTLAERAEMLKEITAHLPNVEIDSFDGLLVDYAAHRNANAILRGIRNVSDYETETQMAMLNRRMRPQTETLFLPASAEH